MNKQPEFKLLLNSKEFLIPSTFKYFNDVNQDIHQTLLNTYKYEIKSHVCEYALQSFINYWIKREVPDLFLDKYLIDYIQLSEEFDIMKDLIQLLLKNTAHSNIIYLKRFYKLKHKTYKKEKKLSNLKDFFKRNIEIIFANNAVGMLEWVIKETDLLFYSLKNGYFEGVNSVTKEKVEINNFLYLLNENDQTAQLFLIYDYDENIFIPKSVNYDSKEYEITSFYDFLLRDLEDVKTIEFDKDSRIESFDLASNSIEMVSLPDGITKLKDSWCKESKKLTEIKISPKNKNFIFYDDKYLLGKSDPKSDIFDILYFARRDIQEANIPPFVRIISPYSFNYCDSIEKVEFSKDSQLQIIGENAFSYSALKSITIPKHVTQILNCAFEGCSCLEKVEFSIGSELRLIGDHSFESSSIESISIPPQVTKIGMNAFSTSCLNKIEFSENSELKIIGESSFNESDITSITIPRSVIFIENLSFYNCKNLSSVEFQPESNLRIIGKKSFYDTSLKRITIPSKVLILDEYSFYYNSLLQQIEFEDNSQLKIIEYYAFNSTTINRIKIPSHVVIIGQDSFSNCRSLEVVEFEEKTELRFIGESAFNECSLKAIRIPSSVLEIESSAFQFNKIEKVEFERNSQLMSIGCNAFSYNPFQSFSVPPNVFQISPNSFRNCENLTNFDFSNNFKMKSLPSLFVGSSIECITLPENLAKFEDGWCEGLSNLIKVNISPSNKNFTFYDDIYLLGKSDIKSDIFDVLIFVPRDVEKVTIPSFIRIISYCALNIPNLKKVEFSNDSQLQIIENGAFFDSQIESISIPHHVTEIRQCSFAFCGKLKRVEFAKNSELKIIKEGAFSNSSLVEIVIPSSVIEIANAAFRKCESLVKFEFAENSNLKTLKDELFDNTFLESSIRQLSLPDSLINLYSDFFKEVPKLTEIKISPKNKNFIFYDDKYLLGKSDPKSDIFDILYFARRDIQEANIPPFVRIISPYSFKNCDSIEKVEFSKDSQLQIIGENAFSYSALKFIKIPSNITKIERRSFSYSSIHRIEFSPNSKLQVIEDEAFDKSLLESIVIPASVKRIGSECFARCLNLAIVEFESNSNLQVIEYQAFVSCSIKEILIPSSVKRIGNESFALCSNLEFVNFSKNPNLSYIGSNAFKCTRLKGIVMPSSLHLFENNIFTCCSDLQIIEIEEGSQLPVINTIINCTELIVMIPQGIYQSFHFIYDDSF